MIASAAVTAVDDGRGGTRLAEMRSAAPLVLRPTPGGLYLVGGAAGPIGGDQLRLRIDIGPGANLTIRTATASVALPGRSGRSSDLEVHATVAAGGSLRWLPEPAVAAGRCHHRLRSRISVGADASLVWRDELVLGRHGEDPGDYMSRISVDVESRVVLRQELAVGGAHPGWQGPAITGGYRAVGSVVLVDPRLDPRGPPPPSAGSVPSGTSGISGTGRVGVLTLPGPAVQVVALAEDALVLRELLDTGVASALPVNGATDAP